MSFLDKDLMTAAEWMFRIYTNLGRPYFRSLQYPSHRFSIPGNVVVGGFNPNRTQTSDSDASFCFLFTCCKHIHPAVQTSYSRDMTSFGAIGASRNSPPSLTLVVCTYGTLNLCRKSSRFLLTRMAQEDGSTVFTKHRGLPP